MMRTLFSSSLIALLAVSPVWADDDHDDDHKRYGQQYKVTVTNATRGQVITPPVIFSHRRGFDLFTIGEPASSELAYLAEDGMTTPLISALEMERAVKTIAMGSGPIPPGASQTIVIRVPNKHLKISAAAMLAVTNDAFMAIRGARVPRHGVTRLHAAAYDAGSEGNSEDCDHIPGPPCGNGGVRNTTTAEGHVHVHAGIHGVAGGDLDPATHDWRNPVAEITIQPMH